MKQFKNALKDYRERIVINIFFSIQILIVSIMISGITYQIYSETVNFNYIHKWIEDKYIVTFDVYSNSQKPDSFEKSSYALQKVLSGGENACGFTFFTEGDNFYLFGNWQNIDGFSTIPFLSLDENERKLNNDINSILVGGEIIYPTKNKNIYLSSSENLDENMKLMNIENFVQVINNLSLFSPSKEVVDSFVNKVNTNTRFLTVIPQDLKYKVENMKPNYYILIPVICFVFITIIGFLSLLNGIYKKKASEYMIHYLVGASETDVLMRMFLLFNIISLPGIIVAILIYSLVEFEMVVFMQGLCIYFILFICSFVPSSIYFLKSTNKAIFLRGE